MLRFNSAMNLLVFYNIFYYNGGKGKMNYRQKWACMHICAYSNHANEIQELLGLKFQSVSSHRFETYFLQPLYISYQSLLFYVAALCLVMRMYCLLCRSHLQKHTSDIIELLTYLAHGIASVDEMALAKGMNDSKGRGRWGLRTGISLFCVSSLPHFPGATPT